ncbi:MAG: glycine--tRNA ligase subunit beta [Pseudomonadota bacterium]
MPDLLLELFSEEIPARMQGPAAAALERAVNKALLDAGLMPEGVKAFAGPRRLALVATGLPARQPDRREEKKGPRVGAPEKAVQGFLKSAGLSSLDDCEQREDKKGAFYVAVIDRKGRDTAELIAEAMPEIVRGFSWQKSMRWGDGDLKWVRPLHRILCAFNGEVVPFAVEGIEAADVTEGHRFMAPAPIQTRSFEDYAAKLRAAKVILDSEERREMIAADAATLCKAQGLELVKDKGLLNEVAGLAEWPVVLMGGFDEKFLTLPDEVLTASMRGHQKYFSVRNPETGRLANKFVCVANIEAPDGGAAMRTGYERVLTARLSDGWYLYNQDLKTKLEDRIADLDRITFFEGLSSVGDKARRVSALAKEIAPAVGADPALAERAGLLAKADLVTQMVYEFPELQGVMGRYYYLAENGVSPSSFEAAAGAAAPQDEDREYKKEPHPEAPAKRASKDEEIKEIADALRDHYKPAGQDDDVPTAPVSVAVALADKIDTLTAFWAIDKKPTGSSDPFALRRAALGVISIILMNGVRTHIAVFPRWIFSICQSVQPKNLFVTDDEDLIEFFHDRLKVYLRDSSHEGGGHRHDHIDAVLTDADGNLQDDLVLIVAKLKALEAFLKTDDGANLVAAYKRAANILKAEEKKGALPDDLSVDVRALELAEEKALADVLEKAEEKASKALADEDFEAAMAALAELRAPLDAFFDNVTVNADNEKSRANRLALLRQLTNAVGRVADFSKLEG